MTAAGQILIWGAAVCAVVGVNAFDRRNADALGVSLMILMMWCAQIVLQSVYDEPASMQLDSAMDLVAGIVVLSAWWTRRALWKIATASLFLVMILNHAAFWLTPRGSIEYVTYLWLRNFFFALQLMCVAGPGVRFVSVRVASMASDWMRSHSRHLPHKGA